MSHPDTVGALSPLSIGGFLLCVIKCDTMIDMENIIFNRGWCTKCKKKDIQLVRYSKRTYRGKIYQYYYCNPCNTQRLARYRKTTKGKEAVKKARVNYELKNSIKVISWRIARCIKRTQCEVCGNSKVDRHHPDSKKPLEVVMLCRKHHKEAHRLQVGQNSV